MGSSALKAADIVRCDEFAHDPCGKPSNAAVKSVGYGTRARASGVGENIAWGTGVAGSPTTILEGWLESPGHRENLFGRQWKEQGIALVRAPIFEGRMDASIWASQFGYRSRDG
jgi:uncharacterized protein YkwD